MDGFAGYHPLVNFIYFLLLLLFAMFSIHPFFLAVGFFSGFLYSCMLEGKRAVKRNLAFAIPVILLGMICNPLFTQRGATILFYLNDAAVTAEALCYGCAAAVLLSGMFIWIQCMAKVMSTDKLICLFGRVAPAAGLLLSISLRFIPLLKLRFSQVQEGQRCMGQIHEKGHLLHNLRILGKELSILIAWSLEAGIETSDSMEARGYGLKGRSSYTIYRFERRDGILLILLLCLSAVLFAGCLSGVNTILYYPVIVFPKQGGLGYAAEGAYLLLCLLPVLIELIGEWKWKYLYSNM